MKVKLSKRQLVLAGVAVLVVLVGLTFGRASRDAGADPLDAPAARACTDFADGYPKARSATARLALADKVSQSVAGSDNDAITERVAVAGRNADESTAAWKREAEALTRACRDSGWSDS